MLGHRLARILGLAVIATLATQAGNVWGDHDNGNGKSQDKGKGKKNHVWCLVSDARPTSQQSADGSTIAFHI